MTIIPIEAPPQANGTRGGRPVLEARGMTKHFPVHTRRGGRRQVVHAVEDVTLALPASGITAVVGESGSGKSTLARLLAQLIKPTSGAVLLDGAAAPTRRRYARQVQLVLQDPFSSLNPVHSVRYHLARPLLVHGLADGVSGSRPDSGVSGASGASGVSGSSGASGSSGVSGSRPGLDGQIADLLTRVALTPADQFAGKYPHELSGGQRQRVAIARALAVRPRVLLADEPVSMLDVSIRLGVLNLLGTLRDRDGLSILYVTHDIASARYLADVIAVMYAGQIVESGPAAQVTDAPAHPYTQLLLSAAPDPDRTQPPTLAGRGAPPNLIRPPGGCRFHPRCPHAMAVCTQERPAAIQVAPGHTSACWLHVPGLTPALSRPRPGTKGSRVRGEPGLNTDNEPVAALAADGTDAAGRVDAADAVDPPAGSQGPGEEKR